jgi:uncharacterized membrane protein YozB (DUF420 family)
MTLPPIVILLSTLPITAALTIVLIKKRPNFSRRKIIASAAAPATFFALAYLAATGFFAGDPEDWEGLTYALAPFMAVVLLGLLQLLGMAVAAIVVRRLRPKRG